MVEDERGGGGKTDQGRNDRCERQTIRPLITNRESNERERFLMVE